MYIHIARHKIRNGIYAACRKHNIGRTLSLATPCADYIEAVRARIMGSLDPRSELGIGHDWLCIGLVLNYTTCMQHVINVALWSH